MKLALVRSLDAGDPLTQLGPPRRLFLTSPSPTPAADVEVSPGIWRTTDGKLETRFEANEAAKFGDAPMSATALRDAHGYPYGGTATGRISCKDEDIYAMCKAAYDKLLEQYQTEFRDVTDEKFSQKYLGDPKPTEREEWLCRGQKPRELQVGEAVRIEDCQDGYVRAIGELEFCAMSQTLKRLA